MTGSQRDEPHELQTVADAHGNSRGNAYSPSPPLSDHNPAADNASGHSGRAFGLLNRVDHVKEVLSKHRVCSLIGCAILQLPIWGFAMTYGIFQEYYLTHPLFRHSSGTIGIIGTTFNGIMYLSMPLIFPLLSRRWARWRRSTAFAGTLLACVGFFASSFSTKAWHLVITQGVLAPLGCVLIYSPITLSLSEFYTTNNRALSYGIVLSAKNITGTVCPFIMQGLLSHTGFRTTMKVWTAITGVVTILTVVVMPFRPPGFEHVSTDMRPARKVPWTFMQHSTIYIYSLAIIMQSQGYGIAQNYLNTYAQSEASLSAASATLLVTLFNVPGVLSSYAFGQLSDNKRLPLSAATTTSLSAISSALATFFLWGFAGTSSKSMPLLVLFSVIYGFFAGGYSSTWGGVVKEMEQSAAAMNEAIDGGVVYGLLNGARGIGYVTGGFIGVCLLDAGAHQLTGRMGQGTPYGSLILYTGLSSAMGALGVFLGCRSAARRLRCVRPHAMD